MVRIAKDQLDTTLVDTTSTQTLTNKTLTNPRIGTTILDTNGANAIGIGTAASAVNYPLFTNAAAGNYPAFTAAGTDTNIGFDIAPKGNGPVRIYTTTGFTPTLQAAGADTNLNLNFLAKGTGVVQVNSDTVATLTASQTMTNKVISGLSNTLRDINVTVTVAQTTHGFSVGNLIRYNGTTYVLSKADSAANADVEGMVSTVIDANNFVYTNRGSVTGLSSLTSGSDYFLDPTTAGAYTTTAPATAGQVVKFVFKALSTSSVLIHNDLGIVVSSGGLTNPMTTLGDTIYGGAAGAATRLAGSTSATLAVLTQTGTGSVSAAPVWTSSTGTGNVVLATSPTLTTPNIGAATGTSLKLSANATGTFNVSPASGTNPTFRVDNGTASTATGIFITGNVAGSGVALGVLSSGSNEALTINALGTGTIGIGSVSTGAVTITPATTITGALTLGSTVNKVTITPPTTSATLTLITGSTLATSGAFSLTLTSTATTVATFPSGTITLQDLGSAQTITGTKTFSTAPVFNALPTGTAVASASTASTLVARDSNANTASNSFIQAYATTATAAGTTTLTVSSNEQQYFTGTSTQTVALPITSTLVLGQQYWITNLSTGKVTVQSSGANTVLVLLQGMTAVFTCILTSGTTAASWSVTQQLAGSNRQDNTTNSATAPRIEYGAGVITNGAAKAVAFSSSFTGIPTVIVTNVGGNSAAGTYAYPSVGGASGTFTDRVISAVSQSTTGFTAQTSGTAPTSTQGITFTWIAIGV